jgi:dinuclear metal center YbgI/SA1388 family protein
MIPLKSLIQYSDQLLSSASFSDYCPNGLQVEGRSEVQRIVSGVTACQALIDQAVMLQADVLLVHHGYFWKGETQPIVGIKRRRIKSLLENDISLVAYHLPLDAHAELGNNAVLGRRLRISGAEPLNSEGIGSVGVLDEAMPAIMLARRLEQVLGRAPLSIVAGDFPVERVAWCTGAAQGHIEQAAASGADAYISGEISEQTVHLARELGIHYFAAGHHATERYGVMALGEHLAERFGLCHEFVDIDNPV